MPTRRANPPQEKPAVRKPTAAGRLSSRLQAFGVLGALVLTVVLVAGLAACYQRQSWQTWLAKMKLFRPEGPRRSWRQGQDGRAAVAFEGNGRAKLGNFCVQTYDPITGSTLQTDFRLEGVTACPDEDAFWEFMDRHESCFREQVMVTVRSSAPGEIADGKRLGRMVVARVNRVLGESFLKSVEVKDLAFSMAVANGPRAPLELDSP